MIHDGAEMSKSIPLTYLLGLDIDNEERRRQYLHEAAVSGIKNIVLASNIIAAIVWSPAMEGIIRKEVEQEGLTFVDSHAPFGPDIDMNMPDICRMNSLRHLLHIKIAASMNVDTITIHIGNDHTCVGDSVDVQIDRICSKLDQLLPEAEKNNVVICIENICLPINTPENLWRIKKRFDTPYLGFCYDSGHANLVDKARNMETSYVHRVWSKFTDETPALDDKILEKMLPYVVNCHIHDNFGDRDQHDLPGSGNIDWQKIVPLLKSAPRLRSIQAEIGCLRNSLSLRRYSECFEKLFNF